MTKTSQTQCQIHSEIKPYTILTSGFFDVQKQNKLQGNHSHFSYLDDNSTMYQSISRTEWEYMKVIVSPSSHTHLDYSKYKFDLKELKFNREEINDRYNDLY